MLSLWELLHNQHSFSTGGEVDFFFPPHHMLCEILSCISSPFAFCTACPKDVIPPPLRNCSFHSLCSFIIKRVTAMRVKPPWTELRETQKAPAAISYCEKRNCLVISTWMSHNCRPPPLPHGPISAKHADSAEKQFCISSLGTPSAGRSSQSEKRKVIYWEHNWSMKRSGCCCREEGVSSFWVFECTESLVLWWWHEKLTPWCSIMAALMARRVA